MSRVGVFASPDEAREFKQLLLQMRSQGYALTSGAKRMPSAPDRLGVVFVNMADEEIPASGIVEIYGYGEAVALGRKPTAEYEDNSTFFVINDVSAVPAGRRGVGYLDGIVVVASSETTQVAFSERMSAQVDSFQAKKNPAGNLMHLAYHALPNDRGLNTNAVYVNIVGYPSVIMAKTPVGGIPAASGTTTRTFGLGEDCLLYQGGSRPTNWLIDLYNFSSTAVAGDTFVLASRDESGRWVVIAEDCV